MISISAERFGIEECRTDQERVFIEAINLRLTLDFGSSSGKTRGGGHTMKIDQTIADLSTLPVGDRLRVVHAIWDTLPEDVDLSTTPGQQAELDRRLAAHRADASTAISHEELMRRVENRR